MLLGISTSDFKISSSPLHQWIIARYQEPKGFINLPTIAIKTSSSSNYLVAQFDGSELFLTERSYQGEGKEAICDKMLGCMP